MGLNQKNLKKVIKKVKFDVEKGDKVTWDKIE